MKGYWYCNLCEREVDSKNVTYEEFHDQCGTPVNLIEGINYELIGKAVMKAVDSNKIIFKYHRYAGDRFPIEFNLTSECIEDLIKWYK